MSVLGTMERINVLSQQIEKYWLQSGKAPEHNSIRFMAAAIEDELPKWISAELITESVQAMRAESKALPAVSTILSKAREISDDRSKKQALPSPDTVTPAEKPMDAWCEVVTQRLLMRQKSSLPDVSPWALQMAKAIPTQQEADAFCRMISGESAAGRATLLAFWGSKNPYGLSPDAIRNRIAAPESAQEAESGW